MTHCAHVATYWRYLLKQRRTDRRFRRMMELEAACGGTPRVERRNLMSGALFEEPYDTPVSCSPAFETYWSM